MKKLFKKPRVWILVFFLFVSLLAINPQFGTEGVVIKNVELNSSAYLAGISSPDADTSLTSLEVIKSIDNIEVGSLEDYADILGYIEEGEGFSLETDKGSYFLVKEGDSGLTVGEAPFSNLRKGLELEGGTRVLLEPVGVITDAERDNLVAVLENRLNTYGLQDIDIKTADGFAGEKYILVEIAGATEQDVSELIASQGIFEAKIGNETVFTGGEEDILFVCRNDGTCSGIRSCVDNSEGTFCEFEFAITLSEEAAQRHAEITAELDVLDEGYLSEQIDFYLDDILVDSLNIGSSLKGKSVTNIAISGSGFGSDETEAFDDALRNMNKLQTVLITGSLPVDLEIVKMDSISPVLGDSFVSNAILTGLFALLAVGVVIFIRYRNWKIVLPMMFTCASEIFIILGFAALSNYNLDLAAIAGIIAAVGTGVDDQIVIIDEVLGKKEEYELKWVKRIKRAFFIILIAYATTVAAMVPLWTANAGLLKAFAYVTVIGISVGVFVTRPAFAAIVEKFINME